MNKKKDLQIRLIMKMTNQQGEREILSDFSVELPAFVRYAHLWYALWYRLRYWEQAQQLHEYKSAHSATSLKSL